LPTRLIIDSWNCTVVSAFSEILGPGYAQFPQPTVSARIPLESLFLARSRHAKDATRGWLPAKAIATQLGIPLRTPQRRIRALMESTGTANRTQLAWYAAQHRLD
jgi:DNA-binding NarL/FixJ family response regulator